ncbi:acyltransferase family protein [Leucobacter japonicus]|uniref:acyltransferase family protein n=1 Tax=Leucobacter japonicus TaxID=1461259 RepID=UPI00138F5B57|nr:acyltransferase family protein [Leucobacter japonicus]
MTYRHDVDGLRAVAVLLVVIYHVWLGRVSGGVDAFLMISAFLLTGSLMRRLETRWQVGVLSQWVRNFKRMLPAAAITIVATVLVGLALLPASTHASLWKNAWASVLYVENWLLAVESVDYYADTSLASPMQHFWSLSVQGQVFILWPLLFLLIAVLYRVFGGGLRPRRIAFALFALIFAVSLTYSIVSTASDQSFAYFNTGARLWEFAAGSMLALVVPKLHVGVTFRAVIGWIGMVALVACGMVLDVEGGFPGYLALWPVLSVAAVIISGNGSDRRGGPAMLLEKPPVLAIGKSSYALYLVHWPILVFVLVVRNGEPLNFVEGLIVILLSLVLAMLVTKLVDAPLRQNSWIGRSTWRGFGVITVSIALVASVVTPLQAQSEQRAAAELAAIEASSANVLDLRNPGAAVLFDEGVSSESESGADAPRRPLPSEVPTQWGSLRHDCSDGSLIDLPRTVEICWDNGMNSTDAQKTVVVVGNSHAQQLLEPMQVVADARGWQLVSFLYAACAFGVREVDEDRGVFYSEECRDWNEDVLDLIEEIRPAAVISIGSETVAADSDSSAVAGRRERVLPGVAQSVERLESDGIPVVLVRDNPRFEFNSYQCTERSDDPAQECSTTQSQALAPSNPIERLVRRGVATIDLSEYFCPDEQCLPVIGNVNVYIDDNHISLVYAKSLAPVLGEALDDVFLRMQRGQ